MIISLMSQDSKPSRLPPMDGEVFPQLNPPPPEPLRVEELDDRAKARQEKKMLDFLYNTQRELHRMFSNASSTTSSIL